MRDSSIDDHIMSQILVSSDIEREFIDNHLYYVHGHRYDQLISDCSINKRSKHDRLVLSYLNTLSEDLNPTYQDYWLYRIQLYVDGWIIVKPKKRKVKDPINWGFTYEPINDYLNSLPEKIANKACAILKEADFHEIYSLIYSVETVHDIIEYTDQIFTTDTTLNKLFNVKDDAGGSGKGEALVPFFIKSKTMGTSQKYDNLSIHGHVGEIKAPGKGASYRFGTKASIGNYKFYANILRARSVLKHLVDQLGDSFKNVVSPKFYSLSMQLLREGDYRHDKRAISTALDSAELNQERLTAISLWFFLAHIETNNYSGYSITQNVFTKRYDANGNQDPEKIINALRSLEYVKDPMKFSEDIDREIHECFKGLDYIIIFREKENKIIICESADDLMIDSVSQNGIKVIEKNLRNREDYPKQAFLIWKEEPQQNYYDIYCDLMAKIPIKVQV